MKQYDIAVIGGGASGLAAALAAAERARQAGKQLKIAVLEKNPRVGKKLLITGNGRCNITNLAACDLAHYHGDVKQAGAVLKRFTPKKIIAFFRAHGLLCRELEDGRIYPYSLQASSVLNIIRCSLDSACVEQVCNFPVKRIENIPGGFAAVSENGNVKARRIIDAAGGKACPQSGSNGDSFELLRPFRHTVTELYPALVQIRTDAKRVRPLKGVRCMADASILKDKKTLRRIKGEVQFTERAVSGICIFELSRFIRKSGGKTVEISLDLAPEYSAAALEKFFRLQAARFGELPADRLTEGLLNKSLGMEVTKYALNGAPVPSGSLTESDIHSMACAVKDFRFPVQGTMPWQNAQVTAGGVPLKETDDSLQSKCCKGIYLCGELLNVDGDCGGFNLQWAWASGITAGIAAADSLLDEWRAIGK